MTRCRNHRFAWIVIALLSSTMIAIGASAQDKPPSGKPGKTPPAKDAPDQDALNADDETPPDQPDPAALSKQIQKSKRKPPDPLTTYKGRTIAQTMHFQGAEWLVRNEREREERCSLMMAQLGIKPGMSVCDMGCGNGFYTLQMAKMTGKDGQVYAVDIQPEMLGFLNERAFHAGIDNITPILGIGWDPRLPRGEVDLMLLVDVYHEFSHPEPMLAAIHRSLAPGGMIVLVEFRAEDSKVPIKPEHKMTKKQIIKEMTPNGFKLVKEFNRLPWQHMMWFGRSDDAKFKDVPASPPEADSDKDADDPSGIDDDSK
jgi:ubiquinone/menaquinone biosynthesis C-methylase UbiE